MKNRAALADLNCCFIVGAPRCGTSAMSGYLRNHQSVCFSAPKETNFFITAREGAKTETLKAQFLKAFFTTHSGATRILGEGSVSTLYSAPALSRAKACFPDAKFIVMVRNPVDLMRSYHARLIYMRQENEQNFETAWDLQDARAAGRNIPRGCYDPRMLQYREVGSLGRYTSELFNLVGRENCLVILYDDFTADTLATYRTVLDFLGLPYDGRTNFPRKNQHAGFKSAFLQDLYSGTIAGPLGRLIARQPRHLARLARMTRSLRKNIRHHNRVTMKVPSLDPALASRLRDVFSDDVEQLAQLLGRDLRHWLAAPEHEIEAGERALPES
jgi:hypothetical protein